MPEVPIPITLVRWPREAAAERLQSFVYGGRYAGRRAPRGIDPEYVTHWVIQNVPVTAGPLQIAKVLELLRFYDRTDLLPHLSRFLTRNEPDLRALSRSLYVTQCIGEIGTFEQARAAAAYYHEFLVPHPEAMTAFPHVLDAAESLAAAVDVLAVGRRLNAAIQAAAQVDNIKGPAGIPFRKYSDYSRNNYPAMQRAVEARQRLLGMDATQRLQELVITYIGESQFSTPSLDLFAGRLIRAYAMQGGETAVYTLFSQIIDGTARSQMAKPRKDFIIHRAAQAILYLQGKLTMPQEELYESIENAGANFLWDDLDGPK